ncbi:MAG: mevalonate kinase [bacterium]|jgi:mevalonate kinase
MEFYSHGKLMLTGEYIVLAGAQALSVPTKLGQKMRVEPTENASIHWKSVDCNGDVWFENEFQYPNFEVSKTVDTNIEGRLIQLLQFIKKYSSLDLQKSGWDIETTLEFERQWGLGSSSTLVANLAKWSDVDPIKLLHAGFKGSGYDVATGMENDTILYQIKNGKPTWKKASFQPLFVDQLFFVYLGEKQQSEKEVAAFDIGSITKQDIALFDTLTNDLLACETLPDYSYIMTSHEMELGQILNRSTVKYARFADYPFSIKSLGGWGGDFVLVVGNPEDKEYFKTKGYDTIINWADMIK